MGTIFSLRDEIGKLNQDSHDDALADCAQSILHWKINLLPSSKAAPEKFFTGLRMYFFSGRVDIRLSGNTRIIHALHRSYF